MDEQFEFLKEIVRRLQTAEIPYMLTGSIALSVYATPRMTRDIDLVIDLQSKDAENFVDRFKSDCFVDREAVLEAVAEQGMFNIIHNEWIIKADFIVRKDSPFRKEEFKRRREIDVGDFSLAVVAPEDLILSKLLWVKESKSELHHRDVKELVSSVEGLDWSYLERWGKELGVGKLLEQARSS
jgi:hypothetical protein